MSKNGKRRKHTIVEKNDILECQSLIWKVIRDKYLDNEGGVYINNIGYLCHKINPNRKIYLNKLTGTINRRGTGGYSYVHTCIDFMPRNKYFHLYISPALTKVDLVNFKSYEKETIDLSGDIVVIWGESREGKSNLIKALLFNLYNIVPSNMAKYIS